MKTSLALLLTSLLLVFSLTACGRDRQPGDADNSSASDGSVSGGVNYSNGGGMMDDAMDAMDDVGDAARNAVRDTGDALTGSTTGYTKNHMDGYTYDQMVRNGRVF